MYYSKLVSAFNCALGISGTMTNAIALVHIYRSFNVKIPIFSLLFTDSIISTVCSVFLTFLHVLALTSQEEHSKTFCTFEFLGFFLPACLGACLTLLITSIRFLLTIKAAKNKHPSNVKVSIVAFVVFIIVASFFLLYIGINSVTNTPFSFIVETCTNTKRELSSLNMFAFQVPNIFNLISLTVDLRLFKHERNSVVPALNCQSVFAISGEIIFFITFLLNSNKRPYMLSKYN